MSKRAIFSIVGILILLLFVYFDKDISKVKQNQEQIPKDTIIVSNIIEEELPLNEIPSYCIPEAYTIVKIKGKCLIQLPNGSIDINNKYNTPKEAQMEINLMALQSKKRWEASDDEDL